MALLNILGDRGHGALLGRALVGTILTCSPLIVPVVALHAQRRPDTDTPDRRARAAAASDSLPLDYAHSLAARGIGPAVMGGRVSSIALDPRTPTTFYAGFGMGGVMKTTDNGTSLKRSSRISPWHRSAMSPSHRPIRRSSG
jgi:hypothetical protein